MLVSRVDNALDGWGCVELMLGTVERPQFSTSVYEGISKGHHRAYFQLTVDRLGPIRSKPQKER
jgi:hypothetical protein